MQQLKQLKKSNTPSIIENKERSQTKKHTYSFQIKEPNRNQHRNNKDNDYYRTRNANCIGMQRKIKNMLEYRSDPLRNILNLSNNSVSLSTHKHLNKLNFLPTPKQWSEKHIDADIENGF